MAKTTVRKTGATACSFIWSEPSNVLVFCCYKRFLSKLLLVSIWRSVRSVATKPWLSVTRGRIHRQRWVDAVFNSVDMVELSQVILCHALKLSFREICNRKFLSGFINMTPPYTDWYWFSKAQLKLKAEEMDERREEVRRVESGEESVIETILSDEVSLECDCLASEM